MPAVRTFHSGTSQSVLTAYFRRNLIRALRGLADGSYNGWTPRVEDLYRLQNEAVTYVDKDGFAASPAKHKGSSARTSEIVDNLAQITVPPAKPRCEQLSTEYNGTETIEPIQPNVFPPMSFLVDSTSSPFGTPASTMATDYGLDRPPDTNDELQVPSTAFMTYDDLMMDIGRSTRLFEEDFLNSILFGPTPMPLAMDTGPIEGVGS